MSDAWDTENFDRIIDGVLEDIWLAQRNYLAEADEDGLIDLGQLQELLATQEGDASMAPKRARVKTKGKTPVNCVQVKFLNYHQHYMYLTFLDLEVGDSVIVNTPRTGLTVARVVGHDDVYFLANPQGRAWVVQKVDATDYRKLLKIDLRTLTSNKGGPIYAQR